MASPTRLPAGLSVNPVRHVLNTFPAVPASNQVSITNEFIPYRSGDFTITQTNGTATTYPWNNGGIKIATTGTTAADSINMQLTSQAWQFLPGNQMWFGMQFAAITSVTDTNLYAGFADTTNFATATNGVFFVKPAGGTVVHLYIVKGGTTTIFQNVSDLQYPDGLYGSSSTVGTLTTNGSGGVYNSVAVNTSGSGYLCAPLILANGSTGSGAGLYCQLGSGGLFAPYVTAGGSGYTTYTNAVSHFIQHQLYYDGKGTLYVGVNGRVVISVGLGASSGNGAAFQSGTVVTAGSTYNTATASTRNFFVSGTQLSTGVAPVQPKVGDVINILPLTNLYAAGQLTNTTANARSVLLDSFQVGVEYN